MKYPNDFVNRIICGDCLEVMKDIPDKIVDMILCDLPYGTTACKWDTIIPFEPLGEQYKRIIKDNGAIVLTASQPFTSALVMGNIKMFKYEWIWEKSRPSGMALVKYRPMKNHENVLIFSKGNTVYNPIMEKRVYFTNASKKMVENGLKTYRNTKDTITGMSVNITKEKAKLRYPTTVKIFGSGSNQKGKFHPTQKPLALFEYLIKTYTNKGDLVLDNCIGSGTTALACKNLKRDFVGIEKKEEYCKIAEERLKQEILL